MSERSRDAARDVVAAWTNPGRRPDVHAKAQADLRRDWPVLAEAIERLVRDRRP